MYDGGMVSKVIGAFCVGVSPRGGTRVPGGFADDVWDVGNSVENLKQVDPSE